MEQENFPGTFIVIEGPDASGKETQTGMIVEWLREQKVSGISVEEEKELIEEMPGDYPDPGAEKVKDNISEGIWRLSFPTYSQTPGGRVVGAYLDGELGGREELEMETVVDIYAADRKQFKQLIADYLDKGGIIVCDRYREANLIHQLVGFDGDEWEEKLEYIKSVDDDLPDADRVFYLDISPEEALQRMEDKEKDIHELDDSYMKKSNLNGRKVARHEDWEVVDGERPREDVFEDLRDRVEALLD
ncbi:MAG: dTMP kinase [Candidatus Nanohalobium sp.]